MFADSRNAQKERKREYGGAFFFLKTEKVERIAKQSWFVLYESVGWTVKNKWLSC